MHGTITDPTGAVIPAAVVTFNNAATGSRQVLTDNSGAYQFLQLPPGEDTIAASKCGFAKVTREHVTLQVNIPATLDLQMEMETTGELVTVSAEASTVSTTDASIGSAFTEQQVRQLPFDTRNVVEGLRPEYKLLAELARYSDRAVQNLRADR